MPVAVVFPGQGTQTPGLGAPWRDHPAWRIVAEAEAATGEPDAAGWTTRLARHVEVPVRWREVQLTLAGLGATTFLEVGNGSMLAALAKRTVPDVTVRAIAQPSDVLDDQEVLPA